MRLWFPRLIERAMAKATMRQAMQKWVIRAGLVGTWNQEDFGGLTAQFIPRVGIGVHGSDVRRSWSQFQRDVRGGSLSSLRLQHIAYTRG